jgi:glycosyltransferase EpsE
MISVLISVFNDRKFIFDSTNSLFPRSVEDSEIILVDDCSSDGSSEFLQELADKYPYVKIIKNSVNMGLAKSLNIALSHAKYDYIARIDADDMCEPRRLQAQLNYMLAHQEIDILGSNATLIDMQSNTVGQSNVPLDHDSIVKALKYRNPMIHPSIMMKRNALEQLGGYNESLRKAQDLDLWHRAVKAGLIFANLPEPLIRYRIDLDKPTKTIISGFLVSSKHAIKNRSFKGIAFSVIDLVKYFLIKLKLYTPRSIRKRT